MWTAVLYDADNNNYPYIKRFVTEYARKPQGYLGDNPANRPIILTDVVYPRLQVNFGGVDAAGLPHLCSANSPLASYPGYLLDYENPYGAGRITLV